MPPIICTTYQFSSLLSPIYFYLQPDRQLTPQPSFVFSYQVGGIYIAGINPAIFVRAKAFPPNQILGSGGGLPATALGVFSPTNDRFYLPDIFLWDYRAGRRHMAPKRVSVRAGRRY